MKKYIFMAVAGMLALSSCSNDDNDEQNVKNAPRQMTFTAGYGDDGAQTRASLYDNMKKVKFDANDEISILSANNTNTKFTTTDGGASATFTGMATDDSKFYAVYPFNYGLHLSGTTITGITIPDQQWNDAWNSENAYSGWDPRAPVAYATTTDGSLQFHNLCAILKVTFNGDDINGYFVISANEALAGTFSLDTSTGALTPTSGSTTIEVGASDFGIYVADECDKTVYVAIAPGTYSGFKIQWYNEDDGNCGTQTKSGDVTFEKGKIYDLSSYTIDYVY